MRGKAGSLFLAVCGMAGFGLSVRAQVTLCEQPNGPTVGVADASRILTVEGRRFRDANRNGTLDRYEDWRLAPEARAADLAGRLSVEDIFGLMLFTRGTHIHASETLTDEQISRVRDLRVRHMLIKRYGTTRHAVRWNNNAQALAESLGFGIPLNNSSDPRHCNCNAVEFSDGAGDISVWPGGLGLVASFDPSLCGTFGRVVAEEYRCLGFATALAPQIDLGTDPRWFRYSGTLGESPELAARMARALCDGMQTTPGAKGGWGSRSVNAMVKHWPGGGTGEAGREAHCGFGKYAVYPNGCWDSLKPFLDGAFALTGGTVRASAVMPYYSIVWEGGASGERVGHAYSKRIVGEMLRRDAGYDGVVCTDWEVVLEERHPGLSWGKPWGVETLSPAARHLKLLEAGCDQLGGACDVEPIAQAFWLAVARYGRERTERRFRESARRILTNMFRVGLFENPYVDEERAVQTVGCTRYMQEGFKAHVRSVIMVKNRNGTLPVKGGRRTRIWIPPRIERTFGKCWIKGPVSERLKDPVTDTLVARYFTRVENPEDAEVAVAFVESPFGWWGYDLAEAQSGKGTGYQPISLQYGAYTAACARVTSIAGGDPFENFTNRTYRGRSVETLNASDLDFVRDVRRRMGGKPVVVCVNVSNPFVPSEIEPLSDAILFGFETSPHAMMEIVSGAAEPSARLPFAMPRDMEAVERQAEDTPFDMPVYEDGDGNSWNFAFGLNWKGRIR